MIYRMLLGVVMLLLVGGTTFTIGRYQERKAEEAMISERYAYAATPEDTSLAENAEGARAWQEDAGSWEEQSPGAEDTYRNQAKARADWSVNEDGSITYCGNKYKRNTYVKAILGIGVDRSGDLEAKNDITKNGQSDAIFVIAQDTARNHVRILMVPRDSVVPIRRPDGQVVYDHLSLSWAYGDGAEVSAQTTRDTVSHMLMDLGIEHFMAVDMSVLASITDKVDGVTVTVPNDELQKRYPEWTRGSSVTLRGKEAEQFLRYRDLNGVSTAVFRMQQHRAFLLGFYSAVKQQSKKNSNLMTELYDTVQAHMITDLKKDEFLKLGLDGLQTDGMENTDIVSLPGMAVPASEQYPWDRVFVDYGKAIPVILELFYREA